MSAVTPPHPDCFRRNETFATSAAQTPAGRRAVPLTAIVARPVRVTFPLIAKQPVAGMRHLAPIETAETRSKTLRSFPLRRPQPRAAAVISPAREPAVHFRPGRGDTASPMAAGFAGRIVTENIFRPDRAAIARGVAPPAGLNRFIHHRGVPAQTPVRAGAASTDSR